ncbi:MAG: hypothetical protein Q8M31_23610 [Beijerinckiaceae bacterium]|nr:hypothetical protein [Beijerinckiaceae bacterium]
MEANFRHDVAQRCAAMLQAAGYMYPAGDDQATIKTYVSVKHRRITTQPRKVHKAPYQVPAHLASGEAQLLAKVQAGGDLWGHQSRKIGDVGVEDGMLNDYGIQHFHLGTKPDRKRPNLIEGTKEILFAVVKENDFYVLGIFDHKAWSKQALIDVVQTNWPQLVDPYVLKSGPGFEVLGLSRTYTDDEAAILRANGINVLTTGKDGSVRLGPGGGVTGLGTSLVATRDAIKLERHIKEMQQEAIEGLEAVGADDSVRVRLEWREDKPYIVTDPPGLDQEVTEVLSIPPL